MTQSKILKFQARHAQASDPECRRAVELFPWFLNGTLDSEETRGVRRHLKTCDACRSEFVETAEVWRLATDHPESLDLATYAEDPDLLDAAARLDLERHLETCDQCADLVAPPASPIVRFPGKNRPQPRRAVEWIALAASVMLALVGGYLWTVDGPNLDSDAGATSQMQASSDVPLDNQAAMVLLAEEGWESGVVQFRKSESQRTVAPGSKVVTFDFESGTLPANTASSSARSESLQKAF